MRIIWMVFLGLVVAMAIALPLLRHPAAASRTSVLAASRTSAFASLRTVPPAGPLPARADSIVAFGLAQQGTPYTYAGVSPITGFDCSGFIMFTFAHFNVAVPHSTALLIAVGRPVPRAEAQPGDIVVFTGTAETSTTPGHAGIVISRRGELPLRFVHASSSRREPFVKVNQVETTDYERRFMQVRRVLETSASAAARPTVPMPTRMAPPVAALATRPVAIKPIATPVAIRPKKLALVKYTPRPLAKKKPVAKAPVAKKVPKAAKPSRKRNVR